MRKLFFIFTVAILTLTSCMKSDEDGNSLTYRRPCYNRVVKAGSEQATFDMIMCEYKLDFDNTLCTFTFEDVAFGTEEKTSITIEGIPFRQTEKGGYVFSKISDFIPVLVNGVKSNDWFVQGFSGTWDLLGTATASTQFFQLDFSISANGVLYKVQSNMVVYTFLSCVNNITNSEGEIKGFKEGAYQITFNPVTKRSNIVINKARLSLDNSLSVDNWEIRNVYTEPTYNGFEFKANPDSAFVPKQNGYDVPNTLIKIVSGNVYIPAKSLTMRLLVNEVQVDVRGEMGEDK
ncbi:MAG: hypothetical protein K2J74_07555 [Muribaculaceae bacterium]|nr:hypothetical protein [Muribaculaceae bacterium]